MVAANWCPRTLHLLVILIGVYLILILVYKTLTAPEFTYYRRLKNYKSKPFSSDTKTILLWTSFFDHRNWYLPNATVDQSYFESQGCLVTNCLITSNIHHLRSVSHYDAVLFHAAEPFSLIHPTPGQRTHQQLYVFSVFESPAHTKHELSDEVSFYNLTMTYRLDSDIVVPYGNIQDIETGHLMAPATNIKWKKPPDQYIFDEELENIVRNKTKLAAWFVSHCGTISRRDDLVNALQRYIEVDIYGKCGTLRCPANSDECDKKLDNEYKFYFAFENSLCNDYVTEKLFSKLSRYVVPVVYGGANYSRFAPPYSYINANDFKTPKSLANYLIYLDNNPKEYMKYFWWKKYYKVVDSKKFCDLCARLNNPSQREKVQFYDNIEEWWFGHSCYPNSRIKF